MNFIGRLFRARRNLSVGSLLIFIATAPVRKLRRFLDTRAIEKADSLMERFTLIYHRNAWGSQESVSGSGSTLANTQSIRKQLPVLFTSLTLRPFLMLHVGISTGCNL
jgi:hypothetical protein